MKMKFIVPYLITLTWSSPMANETMARTSPVMSLNKAKTEFVTPVDSLSYTSLLTMPFTTGYKSAEIEPQCPKCIGMDSQKHSVVYTYDDGTAIARCNGTLAWRNNNPGNLRYYDFAREHGAIGEHGGFAVFPDEETGWNALVSLLKTETYAQLSIADALKKYDPRNHESYTRKLTRIIHKPDTMLLKNMNDNQIDSMAAGIRRLEGWKAGHQHTLTPLAPKPQQSLEIAALYTKQKPR